MNAPIRLSIIIPMYNTAKYIKRCLDSCYAQGLSEEEFEIIVVDDGSTDDSYKVVEQISGEHRNIRLFHQENQGQGAARNLGMDKALGKYIEFLDADDYIEPNSIVKVIEKADKYDAELCFFLMKFSIDVGAEPFRPPFELEKIYEGEYLILHGMEVSSVCNCLFRNDFLKHCGTRFIPGILSEDVDFCRCLYPFAKKIIFTDVMVYVYWLDNSPNFQQISIIKKKKNILDIPVVNRHILDFINEEGDALSYNLQNYYYRLVNSSIGGSLLFLLKKQKVYGKDIISQFIDKAISLDLYPIKGKSLSWRLDLLIPILNCRPLYFLIVKLVRLL